MNQYPSADHARILLRFEERGVEIHVVLEANQGRSGYYMQTKIRKIGEREFKDVLPSPIEVFDVSAAFVAIGQIVVDATTQ